MKVKYDPKKCAAFVEKVATLATENTIFYAASILSDLMNEAMKIPEIEIDEIKVGDKVHKVTGYKWPGIVVSVFKTISGKTRYVIECTVPEVSGALHIYSETQIEKDIEK